jgi:hypothetical protein
MNSLCCCPLFFIPGEDPGSSVEHYLLQRPTVHSGSRLKAGMTKKKFKLHHVKSIVGLIGALESDTLVNRRQNARCTIRGHENTEGLPCAGVRLDPLISRLVAL